MAALRKINRIIFFFVCWFPFTTLQINKQNNKGVEISAEKLNVLLEENVQLTYTYQSSVTVGQHGKMCRSPLAGMVEQDW